MSQIENILEFWFEGVNDTVFIDKNKAPFKKWFAKDARFDAQIREKFEEDSAKARRGECKGWEKTIQGRLALVILFDQFSRNMYRDSPKMFESDSLALALTLRSIGERTDKDLPLIERLFLYIPLQHAESLEHQKISIGVFSDLLNEVKERNPKNIPYYEYTLNFAKRHFKIVEQFGRFPHRNAILKRTSTPQEMEFLQGPGSRF